MKIYTSILWLSFLLILSSSIKVHCQENATLISPLIIGETVEIHSNILSEARVLNIYLPKGYQDNEKLEYPVIYLLDGSMDEDFLHITGLIEFLSFPWIEKLPQSIVVGIANIDRKRDFTYPTTVKKEKRKSPTSGGSEKFIEFIGSELQTFVEKNYRTNGERTLIGQSLGALLGAEILITKPALFNKYVIISPSLWWDKESLLQVKAAKINSEKSVYIAVGKEGEVMERTAKELFEKFEKLNQSNLNMFFEFFPEYNHGDVLHEGVYNAFEKFNTGK